MTAADLTPDEAAVLRAVHREQLVMSSLTRPNYPRTATIAGICGFSPAKTRRLLDGLGPNVVTEVKRGWWAVNATDGDRLVRELKETEIPDHVRPLLQAIRDCMATEESWVTAGPITQRLSSNQGHPPGTGNALAVGRNLSRLVERDLCERTWIGSQWAYRVGELPPAPPRRPLRDALASMIEQTEEP